MADSKPRPITETQIKLLKWLMVPFSRFNAWRYIKSHGGSMGSFNGRDICVASMIGARSGRSAASTTRTPPCTRHAPSETFRSSSASSGGRS